MLRSVEKAEDHSITVIALIVIFSVLICLVMTVFCYIIVKKCVRICKKRKGVEFDQINGLDSGRKIDHENNTTFESIELEHIDAASKTAPIPI